LGLVVPAETTASALRSLLALSLLLHVGMLLLGSHVRLALVWRPLLSHIKLPWRSLLPLTLLIGHVLLRHISTNLSPASALPGLLVLLILLLTGWSASLLVQWLS